MIILLNDGQWTKDTFSLYFLRDYATWVNVQLGKKVDSFNYDVHVICFVHQRIFWKYAILLHENPQNLKTSTRQIDFW